MDDRIVRELRLKLEGTADYRLVIDGKQTEICCRHLDDKTYKMGLPRIRQKIQEFLNTRNEFYSEPERAAAVELLFKAVQGLADAKIVHGLPAYPAQVKAVSVINRDTVRNAVKRVLNGHALRASENL